MRCSFRFWLPTSGDFRGAAPGSSGAINHHSFGLINKGASWGCRGFPWRDFARRRKREIMSGNMIFSRNILANASATLLVIALAVPQAAFARYNAKPASPNFFSVQQEVDAGKQAQGEVDQQVRVFPDAQ